MLELRHFEGAILGAFEAWLPLRGMRTLCLRLRRAADSTVQIAEFLDGYPGVRQGLYPGHTVVKRQMNVGFDGLLAFRLADQRSAAFLQVSLELIRRATSLGGIESLVEPTPDYAWRIVPVPLDLVRLSVGIEDSDDQIADLGKALDRF